MGRFLRTVVLAFALATALVPAGASAQEKSFTLVSLDTTAVIRPDGSMDVVERVRYRFSGQFTVGIRSFENDREKVVDFAASDETGSLRVDPPSRSVSGEWEWFFAEPIANQERTFTVSYTVRDAVAVGPDVGELYWQFIGDDHPGIGSMTVALAVPGDPPNATPTTPDDDASVLRAWGHGPRNGVVELGATEGQPDVFAAVSAVPAATFVELRVLIPTSAFTVEPSGGPRLADVIEEEGGFVSAMTAKPQPYRDLGQRMAPIAAATGVIGLLLLWFGFGRERRPVEVQGDYWREPLDVPPAVAVVNLARGKVDKGDAIAATIIDMAQRGYLTIADVHEERFGPDKRFHVFRWLGKPYDATVRPFEKTVMEMVFHGRAEVTDDSIRDWAEANRTTAASRLNRMARQLEQEHESRGYDAPTDGWALGLLAVLCLLVGGAGALGIVFGAPLGWLAVVTAVAVFVAGLKVLANRSQVGVEEAARAEGLRRYLADFSNLEEAPVGHLILWERYLVYAVAFGVSADLLRGLATKVPQVATDPRFGAWYLGPQGRYGRFDGIGSMRTVGSSISSAFTPPSSSGSGGGFSGGGGGGGGGGGFGAR